MARALGLIERVSRGICAAAGNPTMAENNGACPHCGLKAPSPGCALWPTFESEARAAITAVRAGDRGR